MVRAGDADKNCLFFSRWRKSCLTDLITKLITKSKRELCHQPDSGLLISEDGRVPPGATCFTGLNLTSDVNTATDHLMFDHSTSSLYASIVDRCLCHDPSLGISIKTTCGHDSCAWAPSEGNALSCCVCLRLCCTLHLLHLLQVCIAAWHQGSSLAAAIVQVSRKPSITCSHSQATKSSTTGVKVAGYSSHLR
jgi:hypothetical protein